MPEQQDDLGLPFKGEQGFVIMDFPGRGSFRATTGDIGSFPTISQARGVDRSIIEHWESAMGNKGYAVVLTADVNPKGEHLWEQLGYEPTVGEHTPVRVKALNQRGTAIIQETRDAVLRHHPDERHQRFLAYLYFHEGSFDPVYSPLGTTVLGKLSPNASRKSIFAAFQQAGYTQLEISATYDQICTHLRQKTEQAKAAAKSVENGGRIVKPLSGQRERRIGADLMIEDQGVALIEPTVGEAIMIDHKGQDAVSSGKHSIAVADGLGDEGLDSKQVRLLAEETALFATDLLDRTALQFSQAGNFAEAIATIQEAIAKFQKAMLLKYRRRAGATLMAAGKIADKLVVVRIGDSYAFRVRDGTFTQLNTLRISPQGIMEKLRERNMSPEEFQAIEGGAPFTVGLHLQPPKIELHQLRRGDMIYLASDGGLGVHSFRKVAIQARTPEEFDALMWDKIRNNPAYKIMPNGQVSLGIGDDATITCMGIL